MKKLSPPKGLNIMLAKKARGNIRQTQTEGHFPKQRVRTLQKCHGQKRQRKPEKFFQIKGERHVGSMQCVILDWILNGWGQRRHDTYENYYWVKQWKCGFGNSIDSILYFLIRAQCCDYVREHPCF